jgi:hypothetical protein
VDRPTYLAVEAIEEKEEEVIKILFTPLLKK